MFVLYNERVLILLLPSLFLKKKTAVFGQLATLIPRVYTYYISTFLFAIFGLKMLHDGYHMSPNDAQEELEEVQSDLKKREDEVNSLIFKHNDIVTSIINQFIFRFTLV